MRIIGLALCLAAALPALAADPGWDRLGQVSKTQKVKIHLADGKPVSGYIQEVRPEGLTFVKGGQVTQIPRENIESVTRQSRRRAAMWGAIIGGSIGGAILAAKAGTIVDKNNPTAADRAGSALIGAGLFGGAGAAIGLAGGTDHTIYRTTVKQPKR
jgi:hypothetical protein